MIYTIYIVSPEGYQHSKCFAEVAISLCSGIRTLGHECKIVTNRAGCAGKTIILGGHLLQGEEFPAGTVVYNLEQITPRSPWLTDSYLSLLATYGLEVWDYSESNITALKAMGISAKLCRIGYVKELTCIENSPVADIDVLFVGSLNERREKILYELAARGLNVIRAFGVYGLARDALVARAKVVLNVHFYPAKIFEVVRCSYMMANRKCVVSEGPVEAGFSEGVRFADYENIVDVCCNLAGSVVKREDLGNRALAVFGAMKQEDYLRGLV